MSRGDRAPVSGHARDGALAGKPARLCRYPLLCGVCWGARRWAARDGPPTETANRCCGL